MKEFAAVYLTIGILYQLVTAVVNLSTGQVSLQDVQDHPSLVAFLVSVGIFIWPFLIVFNTIELLIVVINLVSDDG